MKFDIEKENSAGGDELKEKKVIMTANCNSLSFGGLNKKNKRINQ